MIFFLAVLPALYIIWLIVIFIAWKRMPGKVENQSFNENVAIIIPVRNEESNIGLLLSDLNNQDYPHHLISVFVIDDASTDMTSVVVKQMQSKVHYRLEYGLLEERFGLHHCFSLK